MTAAFRLALRRILTVGVVAPLALLVLMALVPHGIVRDWLIVGVDVWMIANLVLALARYMVEQMARAEGH